MRVRNNTHTRVFISRDACVMVRGVLRIAKDANALCRSTFSICLDDLRIPPNFRD